MKKNKHMLLLLCTMILSVLFSAAYTFPVFAGTEKELRLICETGSEKVGNMLWRIYKVAERRNGSFVLTDSFQNDPVDLSGITEENIGILAETLGRFVSANSVTPDANGSTDAEGIVQFSGLEPGLYLAVPQTTEKDGIRYTASPLLAELTEDGEAVFPKLYRAATLGEPMVSTTVPTQTTVSQTTAVTTVSAPTTTTEKLPQTGQLWWPVPILAIGGIVFIMSGMSIRKKSHE